MRFDPDRHQRRSTRLAGYDYTQAGWYFVTICTYQRLFLFDDPRLRAIAEEAWCTMPHIDPFVQLDEWVVMPNHMHGIIIILDQPPTRPEHDAEEVPLPTNGFTRRSDMPGLGINVIPGSLSAIIRTYKTRVTRRANRLNRLTGGPIWQRNFWEHVIRDQEELDAIRHYIRDNPRRWSEDRDNLDALLTRMHPD